MEKVTLADFIAATLASISDGVRRAQEHSHSNDGIPIAPNSVDGTRLDIGDQLVKFSVTIEATAGSNAAAKGELGGPIISLIAGSVGLNGSREKKNSSHHTIEFAIPMHFQLRWKATLDAEERVK